MFLTFSLFLVFKKILYTANTFMEALWRREGKGKEIFNNPEEIYHYFEFNWRYWFVDVSFFSSLFSMNYILNYRTVTPHLVIRFRVKVNLVWGREREFEHTFSLRQITLSSWWNAITPGKQTCTSTFPNNSTIQGSSLIFVCCVIKSTVGSGAIKCNLPVFSEAAMGGDTEHLGFYILNCELFCRHCIHFVLPREYFVLSCMLLCKL